VGAGVLDGALRRNHDAQSEGSANESLAPQEQSSAVNAEQRRRSLRVDRGRFASSVMHYAGDEKPAAGFARSSWPALTR
jgi:hypothetical protein